MSLPLLRRSLALAIFGSSALGACDAHAPPPSPPAPPPVAASSAAPPAASTGAEAASSASSAPAEPPYPPPPAPDPPIVLHAGGKNAVRGDAGLVSTVEPNATRVGIDVLRRGGNAVDAAVAIAFALAVTHPSAGNLGGGGFMIVRLAGGETHAVDFRETAPASATPEKNRQMLDAGAVGYASAAVPGSVAGLVLSLDKLGTRRLPELLAPAIQLARKGHRLGARQAQVLAWSWDKLSHDPAARAVYGHKGHPLAQGDLLRQPDLARTLEAIAKDGPRGFYEGPIAQKIDRAMRAHGGLVTAADLAGYEAKLREPLRFSYRGFTVDTMPPPSMGGIAFAEIMLTLERSQAQLAPLDSGLSLHLFIEASRRAYAERRLAGADPDFMAPDAAAKLTAQLLDGAHLATFRPPIDPDHATPSSAIAAAQDEDPYESPQTTHFSVIDAAGNAVSCTTTQSASFGSKIVIPGTGILLGNAMGAFSGSGPNALAPGKRMASSMTPAIASQGGRLALVLGSPGGDTIPNTVAQVMRNAVDYGMTIDQAVAHGRIHHQYLPDKVRIERASPPPKETLADLVRRGHVLELDAMPIGDANDLLVDAAGVAWGYADLREGGKAEGLEKGPRPTASPP
jgi:gamma-glutamyltranspeptidase / glutathione hydrolase